VTAIGSWCEVANVLEAVFAAGLVGGIEPLRRPLLRQAGHQKPPRQAKPRRKAPAAPMAGDARPVPGLILISEGSALSLESRRPVRVPHPWELDPHAIWNCLGLGHWSGFAWPVLIDEIARRQAA
jgi:hypothetical protein